ncbi:MAG: CBS domain-containing protein, partial [Deltaproteobacteria bacterium]|nr:CBS domain-containing protein [Deltaproteobacteria bacterium]
LMLKEPPTVSPADSLHQAMSALKKLQKDAPNIQSLAVVDPVTKQLKGIITLRRILAGLGKSVGHKLNTKSHSYWDHPELLSKLRQEAELVKVKDVMSRTVYQVKPYDTISTAMAMMLDKKVRGVPVVENQKVIGVIRINDIFEQVYTQLVGE